MKINIFEIVMSLSAAIAGAIILIYSLSNADRCFAADYAIRSGIALVTPHAVGQSKDLKEFSGFVNDISNFVGDSQEIQELKKLSIKSGDTTGLDSVVAQTIADHFAIDTSRAVAVQAPSRSPLQIAVWGLAIVSGLGLLSFCVITVLVEIAKIGSAREEKR